MIRSLLVAAIAALFAFGSLGVDAKESKPKQHYTNEGGQYAGGKGSSHKSGHYKNKRTNNHYTKHKKS